MSFKTVMVKLIINSRASLSLLCCHIQRYSYANHELIYQASQKHYFVFWGIELFVQNYLLTFRKKNSLFTMLLKNTFYYNDIHVLTALSYKSLITWRKFTISSHNFPALIIFQMRLVIQPTNFNLSHVISLACSLRYIAHSIIDTYFK